MSKKKRRQASETMARLWDEDILSFSQLAKELPRNRRPHISTLYRWHYRGVRGHHLEAIKIGGKLVSTRQALSRFLIATQA